jgi:hypothetical protein
MPGQTKKLTKEELIANFKKDNMALSVMYERAEGDIVELHDVPVVPSPGNCIFIYENDKMTIVRWGKVLSIVYPINERVVMMAATSSAAQMKQLDKLMEREGNGEGSEVG